MIVEQLVVVLLVDIIALIGLNVWKSRRRRIWIISNGSESTTTTTTIPCYLLLNRFCFRLPRFLVILTTGILLLFQLNWIWIYFSFIDFVFFKFVTTYFLLYCMITCVHYLLGSPDSSKATVYFRIHVNSTVTP